MTKPKLRITGYYGQKVPSKRPINFIPEGICLKLLLHSEDGFKLEQHIDVDEAKISQYIHFEKPAHGSGTIAGQRDVI